MPQLLGKPFRVGNFPLFTPEIKKAMIERDYYLRKARKTGREVEWYTYRRIRNEVTRIFISVSRGNISRPKQLCNQVKRFYKLEQQKEFQPNYFASMVI